MSYLNPTNCPPTQWGIQATHTPTSYKELQRNKVLFSQLPFPAPLLQPHWTSSTNSHIEPPSKVGGGGRGGKSRSGKLNLLEIISK